MQREIAEVLDRLNRPRYAMDDVYDIPGRRGGRGTYLRDWDNDNNRRLRDVERTLRGIGDKIDNQNDLVLRLMYPQDFRSGRTRSRNGRDRGRAEFSSDDDLNYGPRSGGMKGYF